MGDMGSEKSHDVFVSMSVDLLERGHKVRFLAPGWSMHPTIRNGEAVTVVPVSPLEVRQGDIVFYRCNGNVFAHRVVGIEKQEEDALRFTLRGDALGSLDESVANHQILGKVVSVERGGHSVDPYTLRAEALRRVRICGSRLKRLLMSTS
jgi:signal peptidase I